MSRLAARLRALEGDDENEDEWPGEGLSALLAYARRQGMTAGAMPRPEEQPASGLTRLLYAAREES
jgi:hypothetical protein